LFFHFKLAGRPNTAILNMGLPFMPQIAENRLSNAAWA